MSKIGGHQFINISGLPVAPQQGIVLESQAGIEGLSAWLVGRTSKPFNVVSVRDFATFGDALTNLAAYQLMPALGPQPVYYGTTLLPFAVKVLEVTPVEVKKIVLGVGGVNGVSGAVLRARWNLISWVT